MVLEERRKGEQRNFNVSVSRCLPKKSNYYHSSFLCSALCVCVCAHTCGGVCVCVCLCVTALKHTGFWYVKCTKGQIGLYTAGYLGTLDTVDVCF